MSEPLVRIEREGPVAVLTLNRPERHNSLVPELLQAFLDAVDETEGDPDVAAVVLAAEGASFSTGGDVRAMHAQGEALAEYADALVGLLNECILRLIDCPKPVVAAVHSTVTGGSMGLVLASDVVIVTEEATFTPWYGVVGFAPDGAWTAVLPGRIGRWRTADILMRNRTITAEDAVTLGLAAAIVPGIGLRQEAVAVAAEIADMVPGAIRHAKQRLWSDRGTIAAALEDERARFVAQITTPEAAAGMARFLGRG